MNVFLNPEIAHSYDDYYQSDFGKQVDNIEQDIIGALIKELRGSEMLELGCGTGHWSNYFVKKGFSVTGIDISNAMLDIAMNKKVNARLKIGDAQNIPFRDQSVQIISSITMLEFVDDQDKVINEIWRVLKKDGWLILGCLNKNSIIGINKQHDESFRDATFLSVTDIKAKLEKFEILQIKSGVYLTTDYQILDGKEANKDVEPVFIGILAQKK
ncbi:MAG: class I SAM-dependent methyltransferase [Bacteroidales bacterium]|nr:class I SAM-dependent methyltransferase [Bacteroidales bacterium]